MIAITKKNTEMLKLTDLLFLTKDTTNNQVEQARDTNIIKLYRDNTRLCKIFSNIGKI